MFLKSQNLGHHVWSSVFIGEYFRINFPSDFLGRCQTLSNLFRANRGYETRQDFKCYLKHCLVWACMFSFTLLTFCDIKTDYMPSSAFKSKSFVIFKCLSSIYFSIENTSSLKSSDISILLAHDAAQIIASHPNI